MRRWDRFPTYENGYEYYNGNCQDSLKFTPQQDIELMGFTVFTRWGAEGETEHFFTIKYQIKVKGKQVLDRSSDWNMITDYEDVVTDIKFDESYFVKKGEPVIVIMWYQKDFDGNSVYTKRGINGNSGENPANEDKGMFKVEESGESTYSTYPDYGQLPGILYAPA